MIVSQGAAAKSLLSAAAVRERLKEVESDPDVCPGIAVAAD